MADSAKEDTKSYACIEDEVDALLKEAITCSSNLEIKTDDDEDNENDEPRKENRSSEENRISTGQSQKETSTLWCDMESSGTTSELSISNGKIDLSTSGEKGDLSLSNGASDVVKKEQVEDALEIKDKVMDATEEGTSNGNNSGNQSPVRKRLRDADDDANGEGEQKVFRNRKNSNSSSSTLSNSGKKNIEYETDSSVLARRQKDIDYGKNTVGYDRYIQEVPR